MPDTKNILVVTDNIDVNDGSGAKANVAFIQNLAAAGFEVTVCHHTGYEYTLPGITCQEIKIRKFNLMYALYALTRFLNRHFGYNLNRVLEKAWGFPAEFFNTTKSIRKHLRHSYSEQSFDMIITLSKGTSFRPHYALLHLPEWHSKWLAYIHDPYPYHLYPRPYRFRPLGDLKKERFFRKMSKAARWVGFPSQLLMEWMGYDFPDMKTKGVVIPHQITVETVDRVAASNYVNASKFTLVHAGLLMSARQPFGLIKAYLKFLDMHIDAREKSELLFIGGSDYTEEELKRAAGQESSVRFILKNIPFSEAIAIQNCTDVNVIIESDYYVSPFLPGKFPHCVAAGKPMLVLSPYYSETRRVLGKEYPYWSESTDTDRMEAILSSLYKQWKNGAALTLPGRDTLMHYMGKHNLSYQLNNLLNRTHE